MKPAMPASTARPYPIHEIDPARSEAGESMGSKEKFWTRIPDDDAR